MGSSVAKYSPDGWKVIKHGRETGLSGVERAKTLTCLLAFLLSTIHSLIICIQCLVEINQRLAGLSQLLANGLVFLLRFGFPPNDCWLPAISVRGLDGIYEFKQQEFFAESQVCVILCLRFSVLLGRSEAAMLTGKSTAPAHGQHKRRAKPNATQVPSG